MSILTDKAYRSYDKLSRYSTNPFYYHTVDKKYIYGTDNHLDTTTPYKLHIVKRGETLDDLALEYYNNPTHYWIIASFNRIRDPFIQPEEGSSIKIPSLSTINFENKLL